MYIFSCLVISSYGQDDDGPSASSCTANPSKSDTSQKELDDAGECENILTTNNPSGPVTDTTSRGGVHGAVKLAFELIDWLQSPESGGYFNSAKQILINEGERFNREKALDVSTIMPLLVVSD